MRSTMVPVKLNLEVTRANLSNDSELIVAIAIVLVEDLPILVEDLQAAFAKKDGELVKLLSHTIKGLASNFQAEPLMQLAESLETEHAVLSDPEIGELVEEIASTSERTIVAIKEELCIR